MKRFVDAAFPVAAILVFLVIDSHMPTMAVAVQWFLFLPIEAILWVSLHTSLAVDYSILLLLGFGMPLLLLYWYTLFLFIQRFLLPNISP